MAWTSDDLVSAVRERGRLSDDALAASRILAFADEETDLNVQPLLRATREDYGVVRQDIALVDGQREYDLPTRASAAGLRKVARVTDSGNEVPLDKIPIDELAEYGSSRGSPYWRTGGAYAIEDERIVLTPAPSGGTLRVRYYRRPSRLVSTSAAWQIASIAGPVYTMTGSQPAGWSATTILDLVQGTPHFRIRRMDEDPSAMDAVSITLAAAVTGAVAGDWFAKAGETPVPQIPAELHALLTALTTYRALEACGYVSQLGAAQAKIEEARKNLRTLIDPRVDGDPGTIVNWGSPLRAGRRR